MLVRVSCYCCTYRARGGVSIAGLMEEITVMVMGGGGPVMSQYTSALAP